ICAWHHGLETYRGFRLEGGPGQWRWVPPQDQAPHLLGEDLVEDLAEGLGEDLAGDLAGDTGPSRAGPGEDGGPAGTARLWDTGELGDTG
ncbi:MAG: hypothetical protein ACRD0L_00030, partial [Acidimicrobiales bacterium]